MKTSRTITAALLIASAILAAPAALAEQPREIRMTFAFNPADSASDIYDGLMRTARKACDFHGVRSLAVVEHEKACMKTMLNDGVAKLGRPDVAAVHGNYLLVADTGARG